MITGMREYRGHSEPDSAVAAPAKRAIATPAVLHGFSFGSVRSYDGTPIQRVVAPSGSHHPHGLPPTLRRGVERLSGVLMGDVRVRRDSPKPKTVRALAYASGSEIHLAPGQGRHLAHEAWHVVQQKQGRVKATARENGVALNADHGLEREAAEMGSRASRG